MQRICFTPQVRPERLEQYKQRHRAVWPQMQKTLRKAGWNNYSLSYSAKACSSAISKPKTLSMLVRNGSPRSKRSSAAREVVVFVEPNGAAPDHAMLLHEEMSILTRTPSRNDFA